MNHRYCVITMRMPQDWTGYEAVLRR
ncbi:hypothetical protein [Paenibacillus donghaensis]|nr:hypothetical protein [Paenibacillus donghaensis]